MHPSAFLTALPTALPTAISTALPGAAADDLVRGAAVGIGTLVVLVIAGLAIGLFLLFRRRSGARPTAATGIEELSVRAGASLLQADDALSAGDSELGYAIAQFGEERTREFAAAVGSARTSVTEAFRLKQLLDDAQPDSDIHRREWNNQIVALATAARTQLDAQASAYRDLRRTEADAPTRLAALREGIETTRVRVQQGQVQLADLTARYVPERSADVHTNADRAARLLDEATVKADDAASRLSAAGNNSVSDVIDAAAALVHDARQLLDGIDATATALRAADAALAHLVDDTRVSLVEARAARDNAPDAETGAAVLSAISGVESALAAASARTSLANPVDSVEDLGEAVASLDTALAGARNQQQRLEHARTALVGALVAAKSQIEAARSAMGGRSGVDARTRLAEAERQLMLAESEADPVEALDAARRATTSARDADALARYRG